MVEDDEMVCRSFQVAIRNNAAFSLAGKTGSQKEAMQMLLSLDVDVMLLDLELDEGDGMHLLEEMRAKLERLPEIITVTNTSSESVLSCVRELGCPALFMQEGKAQIDASLCTGCTLCQQVCPVNCLKGGAGRE